MGTRQEEKAKRREERIKEESARLGVGQDRWGNQNYSQDFKVDVPKDVPCKIHPDGTVETYPDRKCQCHDLEKRLNEFLDHYNQHFHPGCQGGGSSGPRVLEPDGNTLKPRPGGLRAI